MSTGNQMAFSLIYSIVDGASAKIRAITAAMAEPKQAVDDLATASEKSSDRQVSAWAKAKEALDDMTERMTEPVKRAAEIGRVAGEAAEKFSSSFAGIGAMAAEGFSARDVANQEEFFRRLRVNSQMAKSEIEELGERISSAAQKYGASKVNLLAALESYRDQGGNPVNFGKNAENVAAAQALGMDAASSGIQLASLARLGITDPKQVLSVLTEMNAQLGGIPDRINAAAEASDRLVASMQSLHMSGEQGALALNAVYGVAARSMGGNARAARTATDTWLQQLADRGYQNQLSQGLGERITDANGFVMDPRIIMQKMAARYAQAMSLPANQQAVSLQRLDSLFGDDASRMFRAVGGQIKTTGHSDILQQALGAQGDPTAYLKRAEDASDGLTGGMNRLRSAMERASEAVLTKPLNVADDVLNHFNGTIANAVIVLAGLVAVGQGLKWIDGAISGFRMLGGALLRIPGLFGFVSSALDVVGGAIATTVVGLGNFVAGMVPVIAETIAWTVALLANPMTWIVLGIVAAIALVTVGIFELYKHWNDAWGKMPAPVKFVGTVIEDMWSGAKKLTGEFFDWAEQKLTKLVGAFHSGWNWVASLWGGGDSTPAPGDLAGGGSGGGGTGVPAAGSGLPAGHAGGGRGIGNTASGSAFIQDFLSHHGFGAENVKGIAAGIAAEGGSLGMAADGAFGIGQWRGSRLAALLAKYGNAPSLGQEMEFLVSELRGGDRGGASVIHAGSAVDTLSAYIRNFMRPGAGIAGDMQRGLAWLGSGAQLAQGGINDNGPSLAMGMPDAPHLVGPSSIYGGAGPSPAVPPLIYGSGAGGAGSAGSMLASAGSASSNPHAHLTVTIDQRGKVKTDLQHSDDMEASLDRGGSMKLSWG